MFTTYSKTLFTCAWNGDVYFLFKDEENPLPPSDEAETELQHKYNKYCQDLRVKVEGQFTGYVTVFWIWMKGSEFAEQGIQMSDLFVYLMYMYMDLISYLSILFLLNIWERNLLTSTKNTLSSNVCWFQDIFVFAELEDIQIEILKVLLTHSDPVDVSGLSISRLNIDFYITCWITFGFFFC